MPIRFRSSATIAGFAVAIAACSPDRTVAPLDRNLVPSAPSADIGDIATDPTLYSQTSTSNALAEVVGPGTTYAADDFIVPAGQVWTIKSFIISGQYSDGALRYFFRADTSGRPGRVVASGSNGPSATDQQTCCSEVRDYLFTLSFAATLPAGTYWLAFQSSGAGGGEATFPFQATAVAQGSVVMKSEDGGGSFTPLSIAGVAFSVFGTSRLTQSITFGPATPNDATVGSSTTITATASSDLSVTLAAGPSNVCTLSGTTLELLAVGTCTITANQAGNAQYAPAPQATHEIHVEDVPVPLAQSITFPAITPNPSFVGSERPLGASASSNLAVSYTSLTPDICVIVNNASVRLGAVGNCIVAADQPGNVVYAPAPRVTQTVKVDYRFSGFSSPVSSTGINSVKAGRTIPLKWRLTDATGAPVTNLTTATITVADLSCSAGSTSNQVEESTSGGSGLQNLGDGYYQLNWKVPGSYSKSCKTLQLDLAEGSGMRTASFAFTK